MHGIDSSMRNLAMINRCSVCKRIIGKGEVFYQAEPECILPDNIPRNQYTSSLLDERMMDYVSITICTQCIQRAKESSPTQDKPVASERTLSKPEPRKRSVT